jgi:hypothetical protein
LAFETVALLLKKGAVRKVKTLSASDDIETDAFFSPKPQRKTPAFPEMTIGTEEKKEKVKIDEDNPPEDWLSPKIYKGSTSI